MANTPELTVSDLANILAALTEVTKPYQLGIQLKIDSSILKVIERDYSDINRQKTEVIEHWLRNSPDASWTTLANAVERMGKYARLTEKLKNKGIRSEEEKRGTLAIKVERVGGHARLAETLREKKQSNMGDTTKLHGETYPERSEQFSLSRCLHRTILLFGKMGHGNSTLGNRILGYDGCFKINDQQCPQTTQGFSMLRSASRFQDYIVNIYDHSGLFEGASSIDELSSAAPDKLNLVIFVLKYGYDFDKEEVATLKSVVSEWKISRISALVLTHCECLSEKERGEMIEQLKKDHPSIAELMGKGILAVGFPDSSHIQPGSPLSQRVEEDEASLRQLIYSCNELIFIPQKINTRHPCQSKKEPPPQNEKEQPPQNENRRRLRCSIL